MYDFEMSATLPKINKMFSISRNTTIITQWH